MSEYWTFDAVEERLVEAMLFAWRDEPGRWPFAGDGPWHLMQRGSGDYDARGGDGEAPPPKRIPLSRAERARMEEAMGWLRLLSGRRPRTAVADSGCDARLVILVARRLARGGVADGGPRKQIGWRELLRPMGLERGADGLRKRYERAVMRIAVTISSDEAAEPVKEPA